MSRFFFVSATVLGGLAVGLAGCGSAAAPASVAPAYFDLKAFLDDQKAYLESVAPAVTKTVSAGAGPPETQHLTRTNWERELAFFYDADLNKPALRGAYAETTTSLPDGGTRHRYTRQPGQNGAVRELSVDLGPTGAVWQVTAEQDDQNLLFHSARHLMLRCDPRPDHNRILSYGVEGNQKLIFFDETRYAVRGEVE